MNFFLNILFLLSFFLSLTLSSKHAIYLLFTTRLRLNCKKNYRRIFINISIWINYFKFILCLSKCFRFGLIFLCIPIYLLSIHTRKSQYKRTSLHIDFDQKRPLFLINYFVLFSFFMLDWSLYLYVPIYFIVKN